MGLWLPNVRWSMGPSSINCSISLAWYSECCKSHLTSVWTSAARSISLSFDSLTRGGVDGDLGAGKEERISERGSGWSMRGLSYSTMMGSIATKESAFITFFINSVEMVGSLQFFLGN